ncbi:MAG: tetratricopeptide repeat protein [Pseudobdellovibrionaceae bacterium]
MKIQHLLVFAALITFQSLAKAIEITLPKDQPLYIEYRTRENINEVVLRITERASGKKTSLQLQRLPQQPQIWYSLSLIRLASEEQSQMTLDIEEKNRKPMFAHTMTLPNAKKPTTSLVLFTAKNDLEKFSAQFDKNLQKKVAQVAASASQTPTGAQNILQKHQAMEKSRLNIEAEEALKREALKDKVEKLSQQEKALRKKQAADFAKIGNDFYSKGQFEQAKINYVKATELDPSNDQFYYQYGVSLYQTGDYNKSLSILSLAEGGDFNPREYEYYIGLNHFKLKDFEKALDKFKALQEENDKTLSPVAAFFAGNIQFQFQNYEESKASFEYVIDNSSDPKMDKEAEKMIEEIDRIESFLESSREFIRYTISVGPSYDGNILSIAKQNVATDVAGYRLNYGGTFLYRYYKTMSSDLSLQLAYSDIYSYDKNLKPDATLQAADPESTVISAPAKLQFQFKDRSYAWNINPSYTTLRMNTDGTGRAIILKSTTLGTDLGTSLTSTWMSTVKLEYNKDLSLLIGAADDDQTSDRWTLGASQNYLLGADGKKILIGDISLAQNKANGKNSTYQKEILGVSYVFPSYYKSTGIAKLEYTSTKYPDSTTERADKIYALSLTHSKDFSKNINSVVGLTYSQNTSNVDSYKYDKFLISINFTYTGTVLKDKPAKKSLGL